MFPGAYWKITKTEFYCLEFLVSYTEMSETGNCSIFPTNITQIMNMFAVAGKLLAAVKVEDDAVPWMSLCSFISLG